MKEKLLLHVCCAPCSIYVIKQLLDNFKITVYFYNPNIFPEEEYLQRLGEVKEFCRRKKIDYIEGDYNQKAWLKFIKGYENEPETGFRCELCFLLRLNKTAALAKKKGFDWFCTSLTMGRQKKSLKVLQIGRRVEDKQGIRFYDYDFKKKNGVQISDWLANRMGLYRQNYCGCVFSKKT